MSWHDWNETAFERARERGCPVLVFLRASWCRWCRELRETVLDDSEVAAVIHDRFVAIEVDKDRRPDIDTRYRFGGWPTLAVLDAGGEVIANWNYLEKSDLLAHLRQVAHGRPGERLPETPRKAPSAEPHGPVLGRKRAALDEDLIDSVHATLLETADPVHGGWGARHKFPHPEALHFLMVRWTQTGDPDTLNCVLRTLRHMQAGEIYDRVEGGFYRYATQPDWSVPHHEKMLSSNAKRLLAYVEAYQALGDESFRATAEGILSWMFETLADETTGAFANSQDADSTYAHLATREARAQHGAPAVDPTIFTNYNADTVIALLKASVVLDREDLRERAETTLTFLMENMWDPKVGAYHYWDGTYNLPGMLTDQASVLRALVEFMHYAGDNRWLPEAMRLAELTIEHLSAPDGSFFDTRFDPRARGGLRERDSSILENAGTAEALIRLGHMTCEPALIDRGQAALEAFLDDYRRFGHHVAGYGRAVNLLVHPPVHVIV
ncbi:MAG: DUF255 domain-containing protein, partial [Planctomycetota bacterium]|nr:DUF255 domain-containing protein [Planctomycetota bacterium]